MVVRSVCVRVCVLMRDLFCVWNAGCHCVFYCVLLRCNCNACVNVCATHGITGVIKWARLMRVLLRV